MRKELASLSIIAGLVLLMVAAPTSAVAGKSGLQIRDATCTSAVHHFNFGTTASDTESFCVFNISDHNIAISSNLVDGPGFAFNFATRTCNGGTIGPGGDCTDSIVFVPPTSGRFTADYTATGNDGSSAKLGLVGKGA